MKHENGYWVKQLTDEKAEELLKLLVSQRENKEFLKVVSIKRTDDEISIVYASKRAKSYITYCENNFKIKDYEISGSVLVSQFAKFMIEEFGEEYADDFVKHANKTIKENPEQAASKRLAKTVKVIPDFVESIKGVQV